MNHSVAIILIRENEIILKSTLLPAFWKQTGYKPKKEAGAGVLGGKSWEKKPEQIPCEQRLHFRGVLAWH